LGSGEALQERKEGRKRKRRKARKKGKKEKKKKKRKERKLFSPDFRDHFNSSWEKICHEKADRVEKGNGRKHLFRGEGVAEEDEGDEGEKGNDRRRAKID